ncbi:hypothetical protein pEaSNUABM40_00215 [Erwinia phage pEa_SNUABM_40]|uniref:Uncharacterized protein n=1 Tax=Erwinia phage pEa_SNUABM_3 TaxID=2869552 RepID=A0AAE8BYL8_9CAUD|nr:hypothetical protein MPK68_gp212 [Erwinia phage pEa_SNUABM_3]QZE56748.1 hypothetical protein pEaSNUABM20_00212 [Erwinia phage pEa_SNUABM_20]QZE58431.1 hypothetical protein pEaSNUABM40_00215 [Erwinia phage pEa_SNUABM_40]UAW52993.1 hypothetical protein pEaSNUABM23_00211 [Erwinia phage pEa_SNUABM_23]UIW10889.1 hypothetical protein pEaSNUABM23_00211 [Erwinia phage pEa_SNUABM_31]QZE56409.1 hypothetical protein pEaSNUABM3_00212 [Erwinia phage pEa_SNUABM_3]
MNDDDFHFDFDEEELCLDHPLHLVVQDGECIIGHLVQDSVGTKWMLGAYFIDETDDSNTELLEWPVFRIDPFDEIMAVANADEMRLQYCNRDLNLGHINNIPFVCNSTRH